MYKFIAIIIFLASFTANAQTKKPATTGKKPVAKTDSVKPEPVVPDVIPKEFAVYSKKPKKKGDKMKLCINLVGKDSTLNYCITDSICRDPEVSKILFEQASGDTTYVLVLVDAFSKPADKPACDAGKETKLFFARWNTKTNKAIWKQKSVASCMRGITNMTKEPIRDWDKSTVLTVSYYKGGSDFVDVKFDPENYKLGLQSGAEAEAK